MAARIPWDEISRAHMQGIVLDGQRVYPTQRDPGDKYQVYQTAIARKAKADSWLTQR